MSATPMCSVCIANYNGAGVIEDCIASVLAQDCGFPVEVIVHDDASPDGSAQKVRERYPQAILIESAENVGFCVANNRMVERARGEYVLLLNNDAQLLPDALRILQAEALRLESPAILGLPQYDLQSGELVDRGCLLDPFLNPIANCNAAAQDVGLVIGACMWMPRSLWQALGGFPEWFGSIAEDLYLCCAARIAGAPVRVAAQSGFRHHSGASFGGGKLTAGRLSTTWRRRALTERNKTFVMAATYPAPALSLLLPLHLLMLALEGAALSLVRLTPRYLSQIYLPAISGLWKERRRVAELRARARGARAGGAGAFFAPFRWYPHKLAMLLRHGMPEVR